jgi:hypothetical protein
MDLSHSPDAQTQAQVAGQDDSIPGVNPATAHFHLSQLRKFDQVYSSLEHGEHQDESEESASVQAFLVLAEARYLQYLKLLAEYSQKSSHENFASAMPLPPW